ncbi:hypothetical protein GM182_03695 [bacterium 3DAC]|nr:hypothetical protein [Dictyoglomota bacterium]UZN23008.1 hypothetical protein GM182_03695 [bacterium 3DAC]
MERQLKTLIEGAPAYKIWGKHENGILGVRFDSRRIEPGYIFTAVKGTHVDGVRFWKQALERGAVGVISYMAPPDDFPLDTHFWIETKDPIVFSAYILSRIRDVSDITFIGVTGTNGKSSTTFWSHYIDPDGGSIGTTGLWAKGKVLKESLGNTTPFPDVLWESIWTLQDKGVKRIYIEVSSHGIMTGRVAYVPFQWTLFTNLEPEHQDAHPVLEGYFRIKYSFMFTVPEERRIIGLQNHWGRRLFRMSGEGSITYGMVPDADYTVWRWRRHNGKIHVEWLLKDFVLKAQIPAMPSFFIYNLTGVLGLAHQLGFGIDAGVLSSLPKPSGRFATYQCEGRTVIVDYAHTPRAVQGLIEDVKHLYPGRRIMIVVGAVGSGDRVKRWKIGAIASRMADALFISPHNPKGEDEETICMDVYSGVSRGYSHKVLYVGGRRSAVAEAWKRSKPGDVLVLAGRGDEKAYITKEGVNLDFSDLNVLKEMGISCGVLEP